MAVSSRVGKISGFVVAAALGLLAFAQVLDVFGLAFWPLRAGPQPPLPARAAAILLLALGSCLAAGRAALIRRFFLPAVYDTGVWITAMLALLRAMGNFHDLGLFRAERLSDWARFDICILSPLFLVIGVASLALAQSPRDHA